MKGKTGFKEKKRKRIHFVAISQENLERKLERKLEKEKGKEEEEERKEKKKEKKKGRNKSAQFLKNGVCVFSLTRKL